MSGQHEPASGMPADYQPASAESQPCGWELVGLVIDVEPDGETVQRAAVLAACELQLDHAGPHAGVLVDAGDLVLWPRAEP